MGNGEDVMTTYTSSSDPLLSNETERMFTAPRWRRPSGCWEAGGKGIGHVRSPGKEREREIAGNLRGFFIWGKCCMYCGAVSRPILPYLLVRELAVGGPLLARI